MRGHDGVLSAVPYFFNLGLVKAAIRAGCHFADLGGNNTVVQQEFELRIQAQAAGVAIAPDCGLSPGMASILAGELLRRIGGKADALKIYVGGLPQSPKPPFNYQLVFSVEGLINEYCEPAKILRDGKMITIEPLTEVESFHMEGFPRTRSVPHLRRHLDLAGNLPRPGRRVLRKDLALSRPCQHAAFAVRSGTVLQREAPDRRRHDLAAANDVVSVR